MATIEDFLKVDIRVGKVLSAEEFPEARKPAYKLMIDLGDLGVKKTSAQLTKNYRREDLPGRFVICVVNFAPRQVGPIMSEVLVLGVPDEEGQCILLKPDADVPLGGRLY